MSIDHEARQRSVPRWLVAMVAALALVAVIGIGVVGVQASERLSSARAALSVREGELATATSDLEVSNSTLTAAHTTRDGLDADRTGLRARVDEQTACIRAQQADLVRLDAIQADLIDNANRLAEDSDFEKAGQARATALDKALNAYAQAAVARAGGRTSTATSWLAKARAYEKQEADQKRIQDGILAEVDRTGEELDAKFTELDGQLVKTRETCSVGSR